MRALAKNWKAILALLMIVAAVLVLFLVYFPGKRDFETEEKNLNKQITTLRSSITENLKYEDVQDELPDALEKVNASRLALYEHFPTELREEDQIMYVLYLEEIFGTEITFSFGSVDYINVLSDGAVLGGLTLTVNYETTYQGFQDMIAYLATDSRITSIQYATMDYDEENDRATGYLTLLCYLMKSDLLEYVEPDVAAPDTGKPNIFG